MVSNIAFDVNCIGSFGEPDLLIHYVDVVDGGHRAIKYTRCVAYCPISVCISNLATFRLHGIRKDVYAEGTHFNVCRQPKSCILFSEPPMPSRSHGSKRQSYSTYVLSHGALPA